MSPSTLLSPPYLIGMPTETVYGLAARVDSPQGIREIFRVKERPFFDPLIVHISSQSQINQLVREFPKAAQILADKFWPGPLTLVLPKKEDLNPMITSGLDSVGIRMPRHSMALQLIEKEGPVAAPSANKFGRTSPTTAEHVKLEFANAFPVLDGGPCEIGLESTVLKIDGNNLQILRPGSIDQKQISEALQEAGFEKFQFVILAFGVQAPGQLKHHYMPSVPLILLENSNDSIGDVISEIRQKIQEMPPEKEGVIIIKPKQLQNYSELKLSSEPTLAARQFYSELRQLAQAEPDFIWFQKKEFHSHPDWAALFDRLTKAATVIV